MLGYEAHRDCRWSRACDPDLGGARHDCHIILYPCATAHAIVRLMSIARLLQEFAQRGRIRRLGFECRCGGRIFPRSKVAIAGKLFWYWECNDARWRGCKFHIYQAW